MAKKPKTHVIIVLDRSGSMWKARQKTVEGYNEWVQQLKEDAKTQDITTSLVTFNGAVFEHLWKVDAEKLEESNVESYQPTGATAFCDAVGYVIDKMMAEDDGDENVAYLLKVISDGEENSSEHYRDRSDPEDQYRVITEVFDGAKASNRWTFDFMGCSEKDLRRINKLTGVDLSNMAMWSNQSDGDVKRAFSANRQRTKKYFAARSTGVTSADKFHSEATGAYASYTGDAGSFVDQPAVDLTPAVSVSSTPVGTADVFTAGAQNCVLSSNQTYNRPEWKS